MSAISSDLDFLELVRKSGLLSKEVLQKFERENPQALSDPGLMSATMLKQGLITSFQCKVLRSGKHQGFILGPYKVLEPIGKGGMGRIFLAEHTTLQRRVAIKALQGEKAKNPAQLKRFYREARAAAALDHKNIVKLFDVSDGGGMHYLVMEYVPGRTLRQIVAAKGPLPYQKAVRYIIQTATGLKHAHEKGFIHRDIKPDNIILSTEGLIKILDMGLARSLNDEEDNLTKMLNPNAVYGSVDYISPEQSIGGTVDARSDLYSLGATLFTLITGVAPFSGTAAQILVSHQLTKAPDLMSYQPSVPPQLNAIVARLMAKKPDKRYPNAGEVIDALLPWSQSEQHNSSVPAPLTVIEPETVKVDNAGRKSSGSKQTQPLIPKQKKEKPRDFSVTPRMAVTFMVASLGIALIILLLTFLINGSGERDYSKHSGNGPAQATQNPPNGVVKIVTTGLEVVDSNCLVLNLSTVANIISTRNLFSPDPRATTTDSLELHTSGATRLYGVPFDLINPQGDRVANALVFSGGDIAFTKARPSRVTIPCNSNAKTIHILGGISGWAYPHNPQRTVALIARLKYKNGQIEEHNMINGTHFADWRMPLADVPTAPIVLQIDRERHLRYISITPKSHDEITEIEFVKGENKQAAPIFFAITVEKP